MKSLKDRKCLLTGAASGIGRATAIAAAREGAELFLTDLNAAGLDAVAAEISAAGGRVAFKRAFDISDYDAVRAFAHDIHAAHGSLDVVMNIAGIAIWGGIDTLPHARWRKVIDVNLMGPVHVMECFLPPMMAARRGGYLVNVSSAAGLFGLPWHAAYSASKFGLRGISEVLRFDLERHRIGVSLVCPGGVRTGLVDSVEVHGLDPGDPQWHALREEFVSRAVTPEVAAAAILDGIHRRRYMVFTSNDVRVGYWFQRKFAWPYEQVMRHLNRRLRKIVRNASAPARGPAT
ncbi:MAG TPA: SDR family oxidoreductase [Candidatus Binatia bacterium]|nr:SDR family oxidoreductase [Candidatus Binatia bacterium]